MKWKDYSSASIEVAKYLYKKKYLKEVKENESTFNT
jgi:hypothetical protein